MSAVLFVALLLTLILYLFYVLSTIKFNYWKKKNVPFPKPLPLLGNYGKFILLQEYIGQVLQGLCKKFPNAPYFGAFYGTEPVLVVQGPEILKQVFTKDFHYFNGREITKYENKEMINQNLYFAGGDKWKVVRQSMTPSFTTAKLKNMFYLIEKCSYLFEEILDREVSASDVVNVKRLSSRYAMDCIATCSFGIDANTMNSPKNNPFVMISDAILTPTNSRGFVIVGRAIWPAIFYGLGFKFFSDTINNFFLKMLTDVFKSRDYKPSSRNDFVDQMLILHNKKVITSSCIRNVITGLDEKVHMEIDDDVMVSQSIVIFAGGFETSASTLSFTLFELAKNPEVQKRAAAEVDEYLRRHGNQIKYECIDELPYLTACVYETLRLYPPFGVLTREVMDDVTLPDGLQLDKGVRVHIPVYSLHRDPENFPEPESYKPERFLPENKDNIKPYTYFPYGEGPRVCIGKRFSKMTVLPGLLTYLKKYKLEMAEGMPTTVPYDSRSYSISPKLNGLFLKLRERDGWENNTFVRD